MMLPIDENIKSNITFDDLPSLVLEEVGQYLLVPELMNLSIVSKALLSLLDSQVKNQLDKDFPFHNEAVKKSQQLSMFEQYKRHHNDLKLIKRSRDRSILIACKKGDLEALKSLGTTLPDYSVKDASGHTALDYLLRFGYQDILDFLYESARNGLYSSPINRNDDEIREIINPRNNAAWAIRLRQPISEYSDQIDQNNISALLNVSINYKNMEAIAFLCNHASFATLTTLHVNCAGMNALHRAVKSGMIDLVNKLLSLESFDTTITGEDQMTALHYAVKYADLTMVKRLIESDRFAKDALAKATKPICRDMHALDYAVSNADVDVVSYLLDIYLDKDGQAKPNPTWHHQLREACHRLDILQVYQEHSPTSFTNDSRDDHGNTVLHYAASGNCDDALAHLLATTQLDVNLKNNQGMTALHLAIENNAVATFQRLLACADIDINACDASGMTALHACAKYGRETCLEALLEREDTNKSAVAQNGWSVIHFAADKANMLALLVNEYQFDLNNKTAQGEFPLLIASTCNNTEALKFLLAQPSTDVAMTTNAGQTPLHLATLNKCVAHARELLKDERIDVNATDEKGKTALHYAVQAGSDALLEVFLRHKRTNIFSTDNYGNTALEDASPTSLSFLLNYQYTSGYCLLQLEVMRQNLANTQRLLRYAEYQSCLASWNHSHPLCLAKQCKQTHIENEILAAVKMPAFTHIHNMLMTSNHQAIAILLDYQLIDADSKNEIKQNYLHLAVSFSDEGIVNALLQSGLFDINAQDQQGNTALHLAVIKRAKNNEKVIATLLKQDNIDITIRNQDCLTAFEEAFHPQRGASMRLAQKPLLATAFLESGKLTFNEKATYFLSCAIDGNATAVKRMIDHKTIPLNDEYELGVKAFRMAFDAGNDSVINMLAELGYADVTLRNKQGNTALHYAVEHHDENMLFRFLQDTDANIATVNNQGLTCLQLAEQAIDKLGVSEVRYQFGQLSARTNLAIYPSLRNKVEEPVQQDYSRQHHKLCKILEIINSNKVPMPSFVKKLAEVNKDYRLPENYMQAFGCLLYLEIHLLKQAKRHFLSSKPRINETTAQQLEQLWQTDAADFDDNNVTASELSPAR